MATKYQFWDKQSDLYTPSGKKFAARAYIDQYAGWADNPAAKCVISRGAINCGVFMEFGAMKAGYVSQGMVIPEGSTDEEILDLMEAWEDREIEEVVTAEERIAAALEYQNLSGMEDV